MAIGPEATSIDVTEWGLLPGSSPRFTAANPSGDEVYFTEYGSNKIAKLDLTNNTITEWNLPTPNNNPQPYGIEYDTELDRIWFTLAGDLISPANEQSTRISVLNPETDGIIEFIVSASLGAVLDISVDPTGSVWFTTNGEDDINDDIYELVLDDDFPSDSQLKKYNINNQDELQPIIFNEPHGIDVTTVPIPQDEVELRLVFVGSGLEQSDTSTGNVTHGVSQFERVGMLIPAMDEFTYYDLPEDGATPAIVSADSLGNVWFGESNANKIGVIEPSADLLTQWAIPTDNSDPFHIAVEISPILLESLEPVFFTEYQTGKIGRLDPNTNIITEWTLPQGVVRPAGISFDDSGSMYIVAEGSEQILKIEEHETPQ